MAVGCNEESQTAGGQIQKLQSILQAMAGHEASCPRHKEIHTRESAEHIRMSRSTKLVKGEEIKRLVGGEKAYRVRGLSSGKALVLNL